MILQCHSRASPTGTVRTSRGPQRIHATASEGRAPSRRNDSSFQDYSNRGSARPQRGAPPARRPVQRTLERNAERARQAKQEQADVFLPRSVLMDKEVITRTSGKRLGYIDDVYVDPVTLEVTTLYLRQNVSSISLGSSTREHVSLSSLRQIGDVVLVHDESSLWDPPGDETMGFVKLVGSEVQTEDGLTLGKIRDFLFNPDDGRITSIRYDALGVSSIPQELLGCSRLDERDIVAAGPMKTIVRRGSERRAIKENDGWVTEYVTSFVNLIAGMDIQDASSPDSRDNYRADPAYAEWYAKHAKDYEMYYKQKLPEPIMNSEQNTTPRRRQPGKPLALPPPQRRSVGQAIRQETPTMPSRQESREPDLMYQKRPSGQRSASRMPSRSMDQETPRRRASNRRMQIDQNTPQSDQIMS